MNAKGGLSVEREFGERLRLALQCRARYDAGMLDLNALPDNHGLVELAMRELRFRNKPLAEELSTKDFAAQYLAEAKAKAIELIMVSHLGVLNTIMIYGDREQAVDEGWTDLPDRRFGEDQADSVPMGNTGVETGRNPTKVEVNVNVTNTTPTDQAAENPGERSTADKPGNSLAAKLLYAYQEVERQDQKAEEDSVQRQALMWSRAQVHARAEPVPIDQKQKVSRQANGTVARSGSPRSGCLISSA